MNFLLFFVSLYSLVFGYDEANIVFAGDAMMHQKQIDCARRDDNTYDYSDLLDHTGSWSDAGGCRRCPRIP